MYVSNIGTISGEVLKVIEVDIRDSIIYSGMGI